MPYILINFDTFCKDSILKCSCPINLLYFFKLRIILFEPSFFNLVNTPDAKVFLSLILALDITFLCLSLANSLFTVTFCSTNKGNKTFDLAFGVFIKSSFKHFSMISKSYHLQYFSIALSNA